MQAYIDKYDFEHEVITGAVDEQAQVTFSFWQDKVCSAGVRHRIWCRWILMPDGILCWRWTILVCLKRCFTQVPCFYVVHHVRISTMHMVSSDPNLSTVILAFVSKRTSVSTPLAERTLPSA